MTNASFAFGDGRDWFFTHRFGLFVHFGLYAIPAWHEQIQWRRVIARRDYAPLMDQFNPVNFDPDQWLDAAQSAGMSYICVTTKHHDGFCLWDTKETAYNIMHTPYGKDLLGQLAEACHRRHVPLCLYYSVADWHQRNYPNQNRSHELAAPEAGDEPNIEKYIAFLRAQVRELCTRYGEIHGFWWDMNVTGVQDRSINDMIRALQPNAVINDRGFDEGDFGTPERDHDDAVRNMRHFTRPTEACQSIGIESWGYKLDEDYYTPLYLQRSIASALAKGGNYLLNVGPIADGTFPERAVSMLSDLGKWYHRVRDAFEGAQPVSHLTENNDVLLTQHSDAMYVILHKAPATQRVLLKPIAAVPASATLLNTGEDIEYAVDFIPTQFQERKVYLRLRNLPINVLDTTVPVIKLQFG